MQLRNVFQKVSFQIVAAEIIGQPDSIAPPAPNAPAIIFQTIFLHDPMVRAPAGSFGARVPAKNDSSSIIVMTPVPADDGVAGRAAHYYDSAMPKTPFGCVMVAIGLAVEGSFISDEHRLVAAPEPETVTPVVGLVADVSISRAPGLDAVVVRVGSVVLDEDIPPRDPAVEHANEDTIPALSDVVAEPVVVIGSAFDQDGR